MTRALILAAGQGTRLRPLTDDRPKCLVNLCGTSLLQRQVQALSAAAIDDICIATGYRAGQIEALGYRTVFNPRYAESNMVATLFSAGDFIHQGGDLLIAYGDILYQHDNLQRVLDCREEIALMIDRQWRKLWSLRFARPLDDAETLRMDENGYVIELGKKPRSYEQIQGQYTGLIKIRADKLAALDAFYRGLDREQDYDGKDFDNMFMTSFLQLLIDAGWRTAAVLVNNGWLEIDSLDDLAVYESLAAGGKLDEYCKLQA